jgi:tetraacyldisaccharide 4'-kinase
MQKILRLLLLPFNLPYFLVVLLRNKLFDWGLLKSYAFDMPIICVGNLQVGGSGKTPTTEYIAHLLKDYKVAILSRGYGRKTKGFIVADDSASADTIGDEPLQYYNKLKNVTVAVCEDRVAGVEQLKQNHQVILLDDAFQHRRLKAGLNILLFEQNKLQRFQFLMPAGNLRENYGAVGRSQLVLITKASKGLTQSAKQLILKKLPVQRQVCAFSSIAYLPLRGLYDEVELSPQPKAEYVFLLTGIANTEPLKDHLQTQYANLINFEFPDHHRFDVVEIAALAKAFEGHPSSTKIIITTEKDRQRLMAAEFKELLLNLPIYYLPITFELDADDKQKFDQKIIDYVAGFRRID